jgi:predicted ester cyclase
MSTEEHKALSNRVAEAIGKGDLNALDEHMAPELAEEFKREVAEMRRAFPDYAGSNVEQIAEGEKVANRFVFLGTHLGEFEGVAPTGKRVEFIGHSIDRVADGRIVESRIEVDMLGVMQQLGAVPEPGQSKKPAQPNLALYDHLLAILHLLADRTAAVLQSGLVRPFSYPQETRFDRPRNSDHPLVAPKVAGSSPVGHPLHSA